jgi:hypothetical protein
MSTQTLNYSDLEIYILEEQNRVRTRPQEYIDKLKESLKYFRGDVLYKPGEDPVKTFEGKSGFEEAIEFLSRQKPVPALIFEPKLSQACKDHVHDIGSKGLASHEGSDGKNCSDRIEKYCEWDTACAESIDFGSRLAEDVIINLIVDDGVAERFQRKNLFNPEFKFTGVGMGPHREFGIVTVLNYVAGVREPGEESPDVKNFIQDYVSKIRSNKEKPKNEFQKEDPDAPDDTVSVKIVKTSKIIKGKQRKITRKIYTLANSTQHIVEIEDTA